MFVRVLCERVHVSDVFDEMVLVSGVMHERW